MPPRPAPSSINSPPSIWPPLKKLLIVADGVDGNLALAARNLRDVSVRDAAAIDPLSLVSFDRVLMTVGALKKLEEALA